MDNRRFDSLIKTLGSDGNRRRFLKGLLCLGGGAVIGTSATPGESDAARRPTPTPKPVRCSGQQQWDGAACVCPAGPDANCGSDCCNPGGSGAERSECCDNACCFGTCYGEELCCPYPQEYCDASGECCPAGSRCCGAAGCVANDACCEDCTAFPNGYCDPDTMQCACTPSICAALDGCGTFDDGCGGRVECICGAGQMCADGQCVDGPTTCPEGEPCTFSCGGGSCQCIPGVDGPVQCIRSFYGGLQNCGTCSSDEQCVSLSGDTTAVCVMYDNSCDRCASLGACALLCPVGA